MLQLEDVCNAAMDLYIQPLADCWTGIEDDHVLYICRNTSEKSQLRKFVARRVAASTLANYHYISDGLELTLNTERGFAREVLMEMVRYLELQNDVATLHIHTNFPEGEIRCIWHVHTTTPECKGPSRYERS